MARKLLSMQVNSNLILWIINFLLNRVQSICFERVISDFHSTSSGSPQGAVLCPFLFTLYTNDCTGSGDIPVIKYSDDTALLDLSNYNSIYQQAIEKFST
ncbi:hypothetical protein LDENG_00001430 [Lucifuga dentata]|nr:hypothetical protein LDENG_00001430 [Lucifuga dentata]